MSFEKRSDGRYDYTRPEKIEIPESSIVQEGEDLLPLCPMCSKSPLTCENVYIREAEIEVPSGDPDEVRGFEKQDDGTYIEKGFGFKIVDGVEYGIYSSETDLPAPFICQWFTPKPLG